MFREGLRSTAIVLYISVVVKKRDLATFRSPRRREKDKTAKLEMEREVNTSMCTSYKTGLYSFSAFSIPSSQLKYTHNITKAMQKRTIHTATPRNTDHKHIYTQSAKHGKQRISLPIPSPISQSIRYSHISSAEFKYRPLMLRGKGTTVQLQLQKPLSLTQWRSPKMRDLDTVDPRACYDICCERQGRGGGAGTVGGA